MQSAANSQKLTETEESNALKNKISDQVEKKEIKKQAETDEINMLRKQVEQLITVKESQPDSLEVNKMRLEVSRLRSMILPLMSICDLSLA